MNTVDWEIFVVKKNSDITFNKENEIRELFSWMNEWSKLIWSSGNSDKNKTRQKFNRRNILPAKNSQSTIVSFQEV